MGLLASTLTWSGASWQTQARDRATGQVPSSPADPHTRFKAQCPGHALSKSPGRARTMAGSTLYCYCPSAG